MFDIVETTFAGVVFQILFLVQDAVGFTLQFIISGKPFIQSRDFSLVGFCHSFTFFVFWLGFGCLICNKDTIFLSFCKRIFVLSLFIIALWQRRKEIPAACGDRAGVFDVNLKPDKCISEASVCKNDRPRLFY